MSDLYDWVEHPKSLAEMEAHEKIAWLHELKKRYEDALNDIIYKQDINTLARAVQRSKQALGVDD